MSARRYYFSRPLTSFAVYIRYVTTIEYICYRFSSLLDTTNTTPRKSTSITHASTFIISTYIVTFGNTLLGCASQYFSSFAYPLILSPPLQPPQNGLSNTEH